jgi:hypothetical protein
MSASSETNNKSFIQLVAGFQGRRHVEDWTGDAAAGSELPPDPQPTLRVVDRC